MVFINLNLLRRHHLKLNHNISTNLTFVNNITIINPNVDIHVPLLWSAQIMCLFAHGGAIIIGKYQVC